MGKKKEKKMSLAEFTSASGGGPVQPRSNLPSAPGEQNHRGGYGRRDGYQRRGYGGEQERSRADESTKWRRSGPPAPRQNSGYQRRERSDNFGGGRRDRDSGDRPSRYGDRDRGRDERSERRREPRDDGPEFGREVFGTKKQSGFGGGRSFDRNNFGERRSSSFRSGSGPRRDRDDRGSDSGMLDRSSMGTRSVAIRPTAGRTRQSYISDKRGAYDGSGSGFGHQLVADCFGPVENSGVSKGATYFQQNKARNVWGDVAPQKSEEQLEKERLQREEKERKRQEAQQKREAERKEAERKRQEKEQLEKEKAAREKAEAEERARLKALKTSIVDMMRSDGDAEILTEEQCHEVLPTLTCTQSEAEKLGIALGMTINDGILDLASMINLLPDNHFDDLLVVMCSTLTKRIGESKFLQELEAQNVDLNVLVQDPDSFETKLEKYDLKCLLTSEEENDKFEALFASHINLPDLLVEIGEGALSPAIKNRLYAYISKEYFTNRDVQQPQDFFTSTQLFYKITESVNDIIEFIDVLIESWAENGQPGNLVELFDHLVRADCIPPEQVTEWNTCSTSPSKMKALVADCDYRLKNGDDVFQGDRFCNYLADVDSIYYAEEEDDDGYDEYGEESQI